MRAFLTKRKVQVALNGGLGLALLAVSFFSVKHFVGGGWPLHHADPILVVAAAVLFLIAYAFKAWGWQRLFREEERPTAGALAFAGGAACVGGVAMPGRVDDAIRIACVKRYPGTRAGLGTIGLSLIIVGMLDNAALAPLAGVAITRRALVDACAQASSSSRSPASSRRSSSAMLPKFAGMRRVMHFRIGRWLSEHAQNRRESLAALLLISVSWALRGTAVFLLAERARASGLVPARARLPLRVGGLGRGADRPRRRGDAGRCRATLLALSGVPKAEAVAFSVAAQALIVVTGAAVMMMLAAWQLAIRFRPRRPAPVV